MSPKYSSELKLFKECYDATLAIIKSTKDEEFKILSMHHLNSLKDMQVKMQLSDDNEDDNENNDDNDDNDVNEDNEVNEVNEKTPSKLTDDQLKELKEYNRMQIEKYKNQNNAIKSKVKKANPNKKDQS